MLLLRTFKLLAGAWVYMCKPATCQLLQLLTTTE